MVTEAQAQEYFDNEESGKQGKEILLCIIVAICSSCYAIFFASGNYEIYGWTLTAAAICYLIQTIRTQSKIVGDDDIDNSFKELLDIKLKECLNKLDIQDDSIKPLLIVGTDNYTYWKEGKDGQLRFNPLKLEVLVLDNKQLLVGEVELDLMSQSDYKGKSNEFFYKDISSVSIYDRDNAKRFCIKVQGETECDIGIEQKNLADAENVVKAIRSKVREAKE